MDQRPQTWKSDGRQDNELPADAFYWELRKKEWRSPAMDAESGLQYFFALCQNINIIYEPTYLTRWETAAEPIDVKSLSTMEKDSLPEWVNGLLQDILEELPVAKEGPIFG